MPEPRFDPLGRRWVLLAPERARRGVPQAASEEPDPAPCDFCGGREDRTPPETYAIRPAGGERDTSGWRVRVVPNLYPATAVHEVVVHTPDHDARFEDLDARHRADVIRAHRDRVQAANVPAVLPVMNRGRRAGASRTHDHGQIFGLDLVPPTLAREAEAFAARPCAACELSGDDEQIVERKGALTILAHPVPLVAHELLIVPRCTPRLTDEPDDALTGIADGFALAIHKAKALLGEGVPMNLVVHTAPEDTERFHWHAHLYPRTAVWGALELGAELPIVDGDPRDSALRYRSA